MKILGLSGSLRRDSFNTSLLHASAECLEQPASLIIYDLVDVPLYNEDIDTGAKRPAEVKHLLEAMTAADALLFANPEFNHSVSGVLKNAIDWASRPAFKSVLTYKPAGIISASMSPVGGARSQMHLKDILSSTLTPVFLAVDFLLPMAQNAFSQTGELTDATALRRLKRYVNGLADWAGNLV